MFELVTAAVEGALAGGAQHADARVVATRTESVEVRNGEVERVARGERAGVGVRALVDGSWGFQAVATESIAEARRAGARAAVLARASHALAGAPAVLAPVPVEQGSWATPVIEHPLDETSLQAKLELLVDASERMGAVAGVGIARGFLDAGEDEVWLVSSEGHRLHQRLVRCGGGIEATAVGDGETQRRSYPQAFGQYASGGFEVVRDMDLRGEAPRIAEEAVALLSAPACPEGITDVVLEGSQVALQIHESVGHAIELDRILGWEAAFAGTSFLDLAGLGTFRYGSDAFSVVADATLPGALGTFAWDDEGTPAQRVDIVRDGTWVGVLSGRDSAALAGVAPGGMVRADGYARLPMVRMTNVGLVPGESSLGAMIAETDEGVYMATNRSWSIDDKRLNFQFGCELAREIRNGKLGRLLRNPTYTGITPAFWASLDRVAEPEEFVSWGVPNCGKGQPMQVARTGHPAGPCRFRGVRVGVRA